MSRLDWERANRRQSAPADTAPTRAQLTKLAELGVTTPPATKTEASEAIDRELQRQGKKRPWAT